MHEFIRFIHHFMKIFWYARAVLSCLLMVITLNSFIIAYFEQIPLDDSLYLSYITALTVGYGDVVPFTGIGRFLSVINGVFGMVLMGILIAIATIAMRHVILEFHDDPNIE